MSSEDKRQAVRFLDTALSLHLVTELQYRSTAEFWEKCGGRMSDVLVELGLITRPQSDTILHLLEQDVLFPPVQFPEVPAPVAKTTRRKGEDSIFETVKDDVSDISTDDGSTEDASVTQPTAPAPIKLKPHDEMFGHYSFLDFIGQGGLGQVTRCCDRSFDRDVALKEIRADLRNDKNKRLIMRFIVEARVTGQLQHPGIVPVHEMGIKPDGCLYYTMKHVQGQGLDKALEKVAKSTLTPAEQYRERQRFLSNLLDVCRAMGYAHEKGVIHRDLKPANVILGRHGETIILDWGLAKLVALHDPDPIIDAPDSAYKTQSLSSVVVGESGDVAAHADAHRAMELTMEGEMVGTPSYMAPEQVDSNFGLVDKQSDVYALGMILYRILAGKSPYAAGSVRTLLREIANPDHAIELPAVKGVEIPPDLAAICMKALTKDKHHRFASAADMAKELGAYLNGQLVSFYTYSLRQYVLRFVRRNKVAAAFLLVAILSLVAGLIVSSVFAYQARLEKADAQVSAQQATIARTVAENTVELLPKFSDAVLNKTRLTADNISERLVALKTVLEGIANGPERLTNKSDTAAVHRRIGAVHTGDPTWLSIVVTDSSGTVTAIVPDDMGRSIGVNLCTQRHIRAALATKSTVCSTLFENAEKNFIGLSIVVPMVRAGEVRGLVCGVFDPNKIIREYVNESALGNNLMGMAMDQAGYILLDESYPSKSYQNLYADPFYDNNVDFRTICMRVFTQPFGVGHYKWEQRATPQHPEAKEFHRIIAWQVIDMSTLGMGGLEKWGIMLMGSLATGDGQLLTRDERRLLTREDWQATTTAHPGAH